MSVEEEVKIYCILGRKFKKLTAKIGEKCGGNNSKLNNEKIEIFLMP